MQIHQIRGGFPDILLNTGACGINKFARVVICMAGSAAIPRMSGVTHSVRNAISMYFYMEKPQNKVERVHGKTGKRKKL